MSVSIIKKYLPSLFSLAVALSLSPSLYAADFIITSGTIVTAIQTLGDNETGTIEAGGQINTNSIAVNAFGINNTVNNAGNISTTGNFNNATQSFFSDVTIANSGTISTAGGISHGILSQGANATINNSGTVSTANIHAFGIWSTGTNAIINNSGTITTTGVVNGYGIFSESADVTIINSGTLSTSGTDALGIYSTGTNAVITNSGTISTMGVNAHAVYATGDNAVINNSGLISATGTGAFAVLGDSSDSTLNLLASSQIIGAIDLGDNGGDNDTVNIYGGSLSPSTSLSFINVENINLFGVAGVVNGDNVVTVDPTGESSRSAALSWLTTSIHEVISQRMAHTTPLKPVQVAALTLSPGMLFQERQPVAWAQVFGGNRDHDATGDAFAYDHDHVGFTLGYEWDTDTTRIGLLGGLVHSNTKTQISSFKTQADSYYLGGYGHFNLGAVNLTASLVGGYSDHENDRLVMDNLNGREVAKSEMDSLFISPSVTLSAAYTMTDSIELRPSASVYYSQAWLDSYREKGTTRSNLKVDDRTLKVLTAKLQLAAAYQPDPGSEFEVRVGARSRHDNNEDIDASIGANAFSYANVGDNNVSGGFAGMNLRVATQDNLNLIVDVELGGNHDEDYIAGNVSLEYRF